MSGLAHRFVRARGASEAPARLTVLHGFLGAGRNWASFARRLVELRPEWEVCLVDLRLHGDSLDAPEPHSLAAAAEDVVALLRSDDRTAAVLGHSFGGKVALLSADRAAPPPTQLWMIDSTPSAGREGGAASRMLARLEASPDSFAERRDAVAWIEGGGFDTATARWMATNLELRDDAWRWRVDPAGLRGLLDDFLATDAWGILEALPSGTEAHVVRARSDSILSDGDAARIDHLAARGEPVGLHELDGGHWLHIDNRGGLLELLSRLLPRPVAGAPAPEPRSP